VVVVLILSGSIPFWSRALASREGARDSMLRISGAIDVITEQ
jgi:hypothetical protein